jgi:hypothetical protein
MKPGPYRVRKGVRASPCAAELYLTSLFATLCIRHGHVLA